MNLEELLANACEAGFEDLDAIRKIARPAVALTPDKSNVGDSSRGSRLGGRPNLPASIPWPQRNGKRLSFIGQIDLGEQPRVIAEQGFPNDGMLLFFYDADQETWGFDPKDAGSFAVFHVPTPIETPAAADWPSDLPDHARFEPCPLIPREISSAPPSDSVTFEDLNLDHDQNEAYKRFEQRIRDGEVRELGAILGGYPDQVQGDMMFECALVAEGLYCGDATAWNDPRAEAIRERAGEWRLLLQVDSVEEAGMMWGDVGSIYFWIRDSDLREPRFDRVWMILQCF